jgi:hypothetical protein
MALQQYFPGNPEYSTWENWNGTLLHYYGEEPIPMLPEAEWKTVALNVGQLATFINYPIPSPDLFETWQDWANAFSEIINGPTR